LLAHSANNFVDEEVDVDLVHGAFHLKHATLDYL